MKKSQIGIGGAWGRIPGQGPKLLLSREMIRPRIDISGISSLTAPPKAIVGPIIPSGMRNYRSAAEVTEGIGIDYGTRRDLETKLNELVKEGPVQFRKGLIESLRGIAPQDIMIRSEIGRRAVSFYRSSGAGRIDRRPGATIIQKGGAAAVGEIRDWDGRKFQKKGPGRWEPVTDPKQSPAPDRGGNTGSATEGSAAYHGQQALAHQQAALAQMAAYRSSTDKQEAGGHGRNVEAARQASDAADRLTQGRPGEAKTGEGADIHPDLEKLLRQALAAHGADKVEAALRQATKGAAKSLDTQMRDQAKAAAKIPAMMEAAKRVISGLKGKLTKSSVKSATQQMSKDPEVRKVAEAELRKTADQMGEKALIGAAQAATGEKAPSKARAVLRAALKGGAGSFVFGFLDNFIMYCAGASIDAHIASIGFTSAATAGIGNAISDGAGQAASDTVNGLLDRIGLGEDQTSGVLSEKTEGRIKSVASVAGVFLGCIAGMVPMAFGISFGKSLRGRLVIDLRKSATPHKYIRKYFHAGKTVYVYANEKHPSGERHRYDDETAKEQMISFGDQLYEHQAMDPMSKDDTGFNRYDMGQWRLVRGNVPAMKKILAKYKRQIGAEAHEYAGLADQSSTADTTIEPQVHSRWGSVTLTQNGKRIPKEDFPEALEAFRYLKAKAGATFDRGIGAWYIPKERLGDVTAEIWGEFSKRMGKVGVDVGTFPKVERKGATPEAVSSQVDKEPTANDVIERLGARRGIPNTIAVKHMKDGSFHFYAPYSPEFNHVFGNKSGVLTGISEFVKFPIPHRKTLDLGLAEEAIEKLKVALPGWKIVTEGIKEARISRDAYEAQLRNPIPKVAEKMAEGLSLFPYQNEAVRFLEKNDGKALIGDEMGLGKQHPIDTKILTPTGWVEIGSLAVGDRVIGSDGAATRITGVFPQGIKPSYSVTFSDCSSVEAGPEHLWTVAHRRGGRVWEDLVLTTDQLRQRPTLTRSRSGGAVSELKLSGTALYLPILARPAVFDPIEALPVPAYTMGQLIANGSLTGTGATISSNPLDIDEVRSAVVLEGLDVAPLRFYGKSSRFGVRGVIGMIRELGLCVLSKDKRIPECYLRASVADRISLLQGLMDADGSCTKHRNRLIYHTTGEALALTVQELVEGLGGIASIREYDRSAEGKPTEYQIRLRVPPGISPFRISRKRDRYQPGSHALPRRTVRSVEYVRDVESVCISVDAEDQLYCTEHCILTHNTLQSLAYAAANGRKMLVVVPKVVRRTWVQEAEKFFPDYFKGKARELVPSSIRKDGMPDLSDARMVAVNYESLQKFLPAIKAAGFDTIVVDESHRIKSPKAKITKTIMSLRDAFPHRILLSGTAVKNKKDELLTQTQFIQPGLFSKDELRFGTIGGVWNKLKSTIYIARQKKDVLSDLPEKTTQITEHPVPNMPDFPSDIGEMSRARVEAAMAKAPITVDFVKELLNTSDSSILVFTESKKAAEKIAEDLGDAAILHHGQMSDDKREAAKAEFQREGTPKRVFVSTRQSLAVGATLTAADKVAFNDIPWTAADLRQAEDRAHRIGQKNNVNVYWITAQDSDWDKSASEILLRKYELNRKLNEGKQLTEAERKWMTEPVKLDDIRSALSGGTVGPDSSADTTDPPAKALTPIEAERKASIERNKPWFFWLQANGKGEDVFSQIESLGGYKAANARFRAEQEAAKRPDKPKKVTVIPKKPLMPNSQMGLFGEGPSKRQMDLFDVKKGGPRLRLRLSSHPLEMVWCTEEVPDEIHDRERELRPPGWPDESLISKGANHKYVKRVPTGKPKPKYRYWYKVPGRKGLVSSSDIKEGSKFKLHHQGQAGHFEVRAHDKARGVVTVRHDESGRTIHLKQADLHRMMQRQAAGKTRAELKTDPKPDPLKLRRKQAQSRLPGTEKKPSLQKKTSPALKRMGMDALGTGGYDQIEGFSQDARDLEDQADARKGDGKSYVIIEQPHGFVLASRSKTQPAGNVGDGAKLFMRGGGSGIQAVDTEYVLMEASDVIASHDPSRFSPRKDYPEGVQERRYHEIDAEQQKIDRIARGIEPELVVNTNPDAINGTPIVTEDGVVLGGNGRTMGMQRAYAMYPGSATKLKSHLSRHARAFGLSPAQVDAMKQPILVRRMTAGKDPEKLRRLGRRMNEALTQGLDPRSAEVALGKNYVNSDVVDSLVHHMAADESLGDFLSSGQSRPFVATLERSGIIDEFNRAEFVDQKTGILNEDGRMRVERVLAARMIPDASILSQMGQRIRGSLAKAVPYFLQAEKAGWDLRGPLRDAVEADISMRAQDKKPTEHGRNQFLSQVEVKGAESAAGKVAVDPIARALLAVVQDRSGPTQLSAGMKQIALEAARQDFDRGANTSMFAREEVSPEQAIVAAFGLNKTKTPKPVAETQSMFMSRRPDRSLLKAVTADRLSKYVMFAVNWELGNLIRGELTASDQIDGNKIRKKLQAFIIDQTAQDRTFARGIGVVGLDKTMIDQMIAAYAKANVAEIAKSLARSSLWCESRKEVKR